MNERRSEGIRRRVKKHPWIFFILLLTGAATSDLAVAFVYDGFEEGWSTTVEVSAVVAGVLALAVAVFLGRRNTTWAWAALGGVTAFQFFCLQLHGLIARPDDLGIGSVSLMLACVAIVGAAYGYVAREGEGELQVMVQTTAGGTVGQTGADGSAFVPSIRLHEFYKTDSLILFLSQLQEGRTAAIQSMNGASLADKESFAALKLFNWYMPIIAIHTHATAYPYEPLRVLVIPSADGKKQGSFRQWEEFRDLVHRLARVARLAVTVEVMDRHRGGVNYEDMEAMSAALREAHAELKPSARHPILVDITSGQASCSAVAAALTVQSRACFEYVSTVDYEPLLYDLRVEPPQSPLPE